jgi:hypothetical protein
MRVAIECKCKTAIEYDPSKVFSITCPTCGEEWSAWPRLVDKEGWDAKRLTTEEMQQRK